MTGQGQETRKNDSDLLYASLKLADAVRSCKIKKDPAERLQCFDSMTDLAERVAQPSLESKEKKGAWFTTSEVVDKGTSPSTFSALSAFDVSSDDDYIRANPHVSLFVKCHEHNLSLYWVFPRVLVASDVLSIPVTLNIKGADVLVSLSPSTSGNSLGFWKTDRALSYVQFLSESQKMSIRVPLKDGKFVKATFILTGADRAVKEIQNACS